MTNNPNDLVANHSDKLRSILARRGGDWGFYGNVTVTQIQAFAEVIAAHVVNADEVWQSPFRGGDRLHFRDQLHAG